jgi:hypothetical protein
MVKLTATIQIDAPPDAPAAELGDVLKQIRNIVLPEGWTIKIGPVEINAPVRVIRKKTR